MELKQGGGADQSTLHPSMSMQVDLHRLRSLELKSGSFGSWSDEEFSDFLNLLVFFEEYPRAREFANRRYAMTPEDSKRAFEWARFLLHENGSAALQWYVDLARQHPSGTWELCLSKLQFEAGEWLAGLETLRRLVACTAADFDLLYQYVFNATLAQIIDPVEHLAVLRKMVVARFGPAGVPAGSVSKRPRYAIGFVCGNLWRHAISTFFMPLLAHLDRKKFMVVVFSSTTQPDGVTAELQQLSDLWYDVHGMSNQELLELIRSDRMDVLIDLDNHTRSNRLWVFSQRAAPIQMTFYGLNASTGLDSMDYRLTDAVVDPTGNEQNYTEKLLRTRTCHVAYMGTTLPMVSAPCHANGFMTFGCFNQGRKVNPTLVSAWADMLRAHPGSRLHVVGFDDGLSKLRLERWMREAGIDLRRVAIEGRIDPRELYQRVQSVDLAIDTWPFGGGVTTAMTLSLGVPVLTAIGPRAASRVSASMLKELGLERYIVDSPEQLAARAAEICADPERMNADRAKIAEGFSQTIGNGARVAAEVGELLIRAIERYRKGKPADHDAL